MENLHLHDKISPNTSIFARMPNHEPLHQVRERESEGEALFHYVKKQHNILMIQF